MISVPYIFNIINKILNYIYILVSLAYFKNKFDCLFIFGKCCKPDSNLHY